MNGSPTPQRPTNLIQKCHKEDVKGSAIVSDDGTNSLPHDCDEMLREVPLHVESASRGAISWEGFRI